MLVEVVALVALVKSALPLVDVLVIVDGGSVALVAVLVPRPVANVRASLLDKYETLPLTSNLNSLNSWFNQASV